MFKLTIILLVLVFKSAYAEQETQDCLVNQNCESLKTLDGLADDRKALEAVGWDETKNKELYKVAANVMPILVNYPDLKG